MKTLVLFSGGVHSLALAKLLREADREVHLLTFNNVEPYQAKRIAEEGGFMRHLIGLQAPIEWHPYPILYLMLAGLEYAKKQEFDSIAIGCIEGFAELIHHFEDCLGYYPPALEFRPAIEAPFKQFTAADFEKLVLDEKVLHDLPAELLEAAGYTAKHGKEEGSN